ncbi:Flagellar hook-length control protein FliK [Bathymodiolus thermophilus thioautotrophic gill symbiont]|uniref:integrin alpha n=1 Tax=Bathymodiolus thermophilus thioautotrophic gill symbiont TaxID=2360 RepID=UPI0010B937F2|nr:integrin alpha [Bathymodiolus thermophilus thioautotrophic gill symbiont]CAB5500430.1 hypothetical protein THERMOT_1233 [Bathymodiolus thermophilus thioautotrophic gill symbiont]SGZ73141.1 Flagellar hook-length control protein FliK [Bathymodiolus thermophilus thioautotrophic gill symbiont]
MQIKTQKQIIALQNKAQKIASKLNEEIAVVAKGVQHIQVQTGVAYQLSTKDFDAKKTGLIAKKVGDDLEVALAEDVIIFDNYFTICGTGLSCLVSLPTEDGGLYHIVADAFFTLEDSAQVVYFYGEQSIITTESSAVSSGSQSFFEVITSNIGIIAAVVVVAVVVASNSNDDGSDNDTTSLAQGFAINGENAEGVSGYSVSSAGDVNGDGLDDLIIGAPHYQNSSSPDGKYVGKSYVVFGKTNATTVNLSTIASGIGGFVINGENNGDQSGYSVSSAGDINSDGLNDLIVGAFAGSTSASETNAGKSFVVFGKKDDLNAINLSDVASGTGGFVINGENAEDQSGRSVSSAGDVNGDGIGDLIIGAPTVSTDSVNFLGNSYVVFGKTNETTVNLSDIASGTGGFIIKGIGNQDLSGNSVSSAGDVNGDGLDDLIVSAHGAESRAGKSFVVFGKNNTEAIKLSDIASGTDGFVINGENAGDLSGQSVSSAGDVNGDGLDDLIIGAYGANSNAGKSYVVFGKNNAEAINLSTITSGTGGFAINGESALNYSGYSVSSAGDVNGDGLDDLIVGAYLVNHWAGRSYVVFGKANTDAIDLSNIAAGIGGFVINGKDAGDWSGFSVSSAGDVNGDGLDDLIVGAPKADLVDNANMGKSFVVFGKTNTKSVHLADIDTGKGVAAHAIDFQGDQNEYNGTSADELFVAGAGNNILIGNGGTDVFNAGAGNDTIVINGDNLAKLSSNTLSSNLLTRVDGGNGIDTLSLSGSNLTLDLTNIDDGRIQDIEIIKISGSGNNTLKLNLNDLLDISSETNVLKIVGNSTGKVDIELGYNDFIRGAKIIENSIIYYIYNNTNAPTAELWLDQVLEVL